MVELKLALGIYFNAPFDDLVGDVLSHDMPLLKSHRILDRCPPRICIICSSGAPNCTFGAYAVALPSNDGIKVTQFEQHSCENLDSRSRQIKSSVPSKFDPWDLRWLGSFWHLQTCRSQYLNKIHRAGVSDTDLYQTDLIPRELSRKPGRKRVHQHLIHAGAVRVDCSDIIRSRAQVLTS